jgi:ribose 5-phosphate isomerase B
MHMQQPKVVLASDHAGYVLKEKVKKHLEEKGVEVIDVGTHGEESVDYPPIIRKGCERALREGAVGIVFGGSGNGEAMAANKLRGIRAALCYNEENTRLARAHNDANIMSLGSRLTDHALAVKLVEIFLSTPFEGGRHARRVADLEPLSG